MPARQEHLGPDTPLGATVVDDGVTIRFWAPAAVRVHVCFDESELADDDYELLADGSGGWQGFFRAYGPAVSTVSW